MSDTPSSPNDLARQAARLRDQMRYAWPANWLLVAGSAVALFFWHVVHAAHTEALGMAFAATWCFVAASALLASTGRAQVRMSGPLMTLGALYGLVMAAGVLQLTGLFFGGPHPLWEGVEAAPAVTLDRDATWRELIELAALGGAFVSGVMIGRSDRRARLFFALFLNFAAAYSAMFAIQFLGGAADMTGAEPRSPFSAYAAPSMSGAVFGVFVIVAAARLIQALKESEGGSLRATARRGATAIAALGLSSLCLALSGWGLSTAMTALVLVAFLAWEARESARQGAPASLVAIPLVVVTAAALIGAGTHALAAPAGSTGLFGNATDRLATIQIHVEAFRASPWLGYGLGAFGEVNTLMQTATNWEALHDLTSARNVVVQWLVEAGLVGAILMGAVVVVALFINLSGLSSRRSMRTWLRAVLAVSGFVVLHSIVHDALQAPAFAGQWALLLGIAAGLSTSDTATAR